MKRRAVLLKLIAAFIAMVFISCENAGDSPVSFSNFNQDEQSLDAPAAGPDDASGYQSVEEPAKAVISAVSENAPVYQSNILNGAVNVEVNLPVKLTFNTEISVNSINVNNVYIMDAAGKIQYNRIVLDGNTVTIIPQIRLQPGAVYTAVFGGLADINGNGVETITIRFTNRDLDYGLYWFGKFGLCEKYFPGVENAFYNTQKQTVIYSHGWQADSVGKTDPYGRAGYSHEIFYWTESSFDGQKSFNGLKKWTNHGWIDKGWNTGIVYWNQFADEPPLSTGNVLGVPAAEEKIWSFNGTRGNRYRLLDAQGNKIYKNFNRIVDFNGSQVSVNSVGDILKLYVVDALSKNTSGNIRLVGHSLGNQVVNYLAKQCKNSGIKINRIALLDPAWMSGAKSFFPNDGYGTWTGERCRNYLKEMISAWPDFALEMYHTTLINESIATLADSNDELQRIACNVNNAPWYYSAVQLAGKHNSIKFTYFWSLESNPPIECTLKWYWFQLKRYATGNDGPSASTSLSRIKSMMGAAYEWTQVEGRYTPDPNDDWFERKANSH